MFIDQAIFQRAFIEAPDAQILVNEDGTIIEANLRVEAMLGYPREDLIGQPVDMLVPDAARARHAGHRRRYSANPRLRDMGEVLELKARCRDGEELPVDIMLSPLTIGDGSLVLVAIRDSSARRAVRRNLRKVLNASPDGLLLVDQDSRIVFVNTRIIEIFGYERRRDLLGQSVDLLVPDRFRDYHRESRQAYFESPVPRAMGELPFLWGIRRDGKEIPLEVSQSPIDTGTGLVVACAIRDISERWAAREALRQSETRYRLLAEHASDVIYTMDFDLNFTYLSPSVRQQRGWSAEEMMALPLDRILTPESMELTRRAVADTLSIIASGDEARVHEHRMLALDSYCKDGSIIQIETKLSVVFDDDGNAVGILGVSRDVTRRRKMEQENAALEEQLRQVQKMEAIGTLAGGVAHDFNNLLTGILGHIDLMKLRLDQDDINYHSVEIIERAAGQAQQLTSQLLGFARKGQFRVEDVDVNKAIADVASFLDHTIPKSIDLQLDLQPEPMAISGDAGQISQVLLNLAVNAKEAMPQGGQLTFSTKAVTLDAAFCRTHVDIKPGEYVLITVTDTGIGMTRDVLARIFEPFFTARPAGEGTGMGLAMVYGVVLNHRGLVIADSEPGKGTAFRVYLPRVAPCGEQCETEEAEAISGKGHILVVDDEEMLRDVVSGMLTSLGYSTACVANGQEAVEYVEANPGRVDMAIVDMIMPVMDGSQCVRALKQIAPSLPIVLTSGYTFPDAKARVDPGSVTAFINKPYRIEHLSEVVASALAETTVYPAS